MSVIVKLSKRHVINVVVVIMALALTGCNQAAQVGVSSSDNLAMHPTRDALDQELEGREVVPPSEWIESQRRQFLPLLAAASCDILVVPLQNEGFGFDRATRWLMSTQLATKLSADTGRCIFDPLLVDRALGEGRRRFSDDDIDNLAAKLNASTVIRVYVGHDKAFRMHVAADVRRGPGASMIRSLTNSGSKYWDSISFADDCPPFVAWLDVLSDIAGMVGVPATVELANVDPGDIYTLPRSPSGLVELGSENPLESAQRLTMLALLAPERDSAYSERLWVKTWAAAAQAIDSSTSRRIRARALFHLGYRPAALSLLTADTSVEARFLHSLVNGNLNSAQDALSAVTNPVEQVVAAIEIRDLSMKYGRGEPLRTSGALQELIASSESWANLLDARLNEADPWHFANDIALKKELDESYPVQGFSLDEIISAQGLLGIEYQASDALLLPARHVGRVMDQQGRSLCCASFSLHPSQLDYLDVISARAMANAEKYVASVFTQRGLIDEALDLLGEFDAEYFGHPHFSRLRAEVNVALLERRPGERTAERQNALRDSARSAAYWEQGGTRTAGNALTTLGVPSFESTPYLNAYGNDFPPRAYWFPISATALPYSSDDVTFVDNLFSSVRSEDIPSLLSDIAGRFDGSSVIAMLRARTAMDQTGSEEASIRAQMAQDPRNPHSYDALARLLIADGKYVAALEVMDSFPGFRDESVTNTVMLSNFSLDIADEFFNRGAIDQAMAMYNITIRYRNGSGAYMLAKHRLHLLEGNFVAAADDALERAQRYDTPNAYRDYFSLMFAIKDGHSLWPALESLLPRIGKAEVWDVAMLGHRIGHSSDAPLRAWLMRDDIRTFRVDSDSPVIRLALMSSIIDRMPSSDLPEFLARLEIEPDTKVDTPATSLRRIEQAGQVSFESIRRSRFGDDRRAPLRSGESVPSAYVLFARGLIANRNGDHTKAVTEFDHLADYYPIERPDFDFALPYFAWSAANSGDTLGLSAYLRTLPLPAQNFGVHLARAFFEGLSGHHDEALESLGRAHSAIPDANGGNFLLRYRSGQMFVAYQYAESCVWLFEATHDARYLDMALQWARKHQRMRPTVAWAYALEAKFTAVRVDRIRAAAMALYLDRNSRWLGDVPKDELREAETWLQINNPFTRSRE